jgi:hypothetical protein
MISEKGSLKDTPVIKLLLTIFEQTLTGILYFKNDDVLKVLYFNRGKLIWAISNSDDDKLENILIARELVDRDMISKIKREAHVSESIGKLLVEKGLITLEELIDTSKSQLRYIILSILKWKEGGFQFIKDAPPERLLSLDLNITDFIIDYILEEVEISDIWKTIGSLQIEFIKNPDEEKLSKYNLSLKQRELLNSFTGNTRLETILSRYSGGHRESLLKIIYFFLMAELLIKKEFELSDSSDFDEDAGFDPFGEETRTPGAGAITDTDIKTDVDSYEPSHSLAPAAEAPKPKKEREYTFEKPELEKPVTTEDPAPVPISYDKGKGIEKNTERKKIKMLNLVMVILILVLGGIILLILPMMLNDTPEEKLMRTTKNGDIITIEKSPTLEEQDKEDDKAEDAGDLKTKDKPDVKPDVKPEDKTEDKTSTKPQTVEETPIKTQQEKTRREKAPPVKTQQEKPKTKEEKKEEIKPKLTPGKSAMAYFREGNLIIAGDIWRQELRKAGYKYSILLELDCLKESVFNAFGRIVSKDDFFILNRKSGKRNCFLVMLGKYRTRREAAEGIDKVPQYFWQQASPPQVIELAKYL